MDYAWTCRCCGKQFSHLPMDYGFDSPSPWHALSDAERATRGRIDADVCRLDEHIFVRGCLEIPVRESDELFVWGVWVSVSERSFSRIRDLWSLPVPPDEPALFGWLCNSIAFYPETYALKTHLHLRCGGLRPSIELEPTDHPLAMEQRSGITIERIQEIAAALMHRH